MSFRARCITTQHGLIDAALPSHSLTHHLGLQAPQALEYLIKGPQIVRDTQPVAWTFLSSPPPDGTVMLTWQPPRMGNMFASDGMVWADAESAFDMNTLQVLVHNAGYHYPHEPYAMHARHRYRIAAGPGTIDPNLWLVHYKPADPQSRIPASQIPIPRDVHAMIQMRVQLQQAGPLQRKDFMLVDQANWPKVEFGQPALRGPQPYYNPMQPGRPYAAQPPPAKRQRLPAQAQPRQPAAGPIIPDNSLEEEENATQDAFDFLTPREISLSRYKQHHEWMEEVFSSPHPVGKIAPIDLGLGLMGELAPLTAGILDVPGAENVEPGKDTYQIKNYYKLEPEQLKDFEKRVSEYTTNEQAEIDKMKAEHAKKMAQLKRTRTYIKAERRLRDLSRSTESDGDSMDPVEEVVQDLEKSLGVTFDAKKALVCVDKGGFIEPQAPSPPKAQVNGDGAQQNTNGTSGGMDNDASMEENSAANLLEQYGNGSLSGTPVGNISLPRLSQPPSQSHSATGTPNVPNNPSQTATFDQQDTSLDVGADLLDLDVEMTGMAGAGDKDWVMVNEQSGNAQQPSGGQQATMNNNNNNNNNNSQPTSNAGAMPSSNIEADAGSMFDTADFGSFDNLDSAGDALADYGHDDNLGLDLVDDSAFGDAFHGTEMHHDETGDGDHA
ncbi:SWI SNF and RSC complexes subunit ssr4 [Pyrenophora seminiperda CCB06]|uniref:SWI SNF and RSC complexes subunit ssr4 n=1 Tax=Pyrenophora seminiperda CCB06 TaxID=1302712 RepID=A0A3M7MGX8_9PLEO|nr:SWI SNF and RSC complexes subunit ssr4 [Pyrenophora seminiperda CCB06]